MCVCVNGDDGADVFKTENESQEERTSLGLMLIKGRWRHTGVSAPPDPPGLRILYRGQGCRTQDLDNLQFLERKKNESLK